MPRLVRVALVRWLLGALVLGGLLFGPAGTLHYWQAWAYLATLFVPMTLVLGYLLRHDPALLERRMRTKENAATQRAAVALASVPMLALFVVAGLDRRLGWSTVPAPVVVAALIVVLLGYALFVVVLRENSYLSRVVEVVEGQQVIRTGPYAIVRHPMYVATNLMYLASAPALGSWWALVPALLIVPGMILRILDEEKQLREGLPGYREYCEAVRWRQIPGLW